MQCRPAAVQGFAGAGAKSAEYYAERDARIAAKIRANRRNAPAFRIPEEPVSFAECGALMWSPPFQPSGILSVFDEYTFAHYGRTMFVFYNKNTGDIGLVRKCRGPYDADQFSAIVGGELAMLATLSLRDGIENARIMIHRSELFTDSAPMRAFAAIIRVKYPDLSFSAIQVMSEWMGELTMNFRTYMDNCLRCEALIVIDRAILNGRGNGKANYCAF
jgi:hypothetical protein